MHLHPATTFTLTGSSVINNDSVPSSSTMNTMASPTNAGTLPIYTSNSSVLHNIPQQPQGPQPVQYIFPAPGLNMFSIQPYSYPYSGNYAHQPGSTLAVVSAVAGSPYVNILGQVVEVGPNNGVNAAPRNSVTFPSLLPRAADNSDLQSTVHISHAPLDPAIRVAPLSPESSDRMVQISGTLSPQRIVPAPVFSRPVAGTFPSGDIPVSTSSSVRSDIHNFFAAMNPSLAAPVHSNIPVVPSIPAPQKSQQPSPVFDGVHVSQAAPQEPVAAAVPAKLKSSGPARKRPKDLLRHVIGGQTIFESVSGPFSESQMAYIEQYYAHNLEANDISEVLAQPESPKDVPDLSDSLVKSCDFCQSSKNERFFAGKRGLCKEGCSHSLNVVSKSAKRKSGVKKNVSGSPPAARAAKPKIIKKMRVEPPSRKITVSKLLPESVKRLAESTANVAVPAKQAVAIPVVPEVLPAALDIAPRDVMDAAPLIVVVKRKPDLDSWTVNDITTLLLSIRGLSSFGQKFTADEIDGQALKLLVDPENNKDGEKLVTEMGMPKWAAYKLKSVISMLVAKPLRIDDLYHVL